MHNYFDETLSYGTSKLCMVGFNAKHRTALNNFLDRKEAVELKVAKYNQAKRSHNIEVLLKNTTEITGSPKKISVSSLEFQDDIPATIRLEELDRKKPTCLVSFSSCHKLRFHLSGHFMLTLS